MVDNNNVKIFNKKTGVEISDHYPVKVELPLEADKITQYRSIEYRNFKEIKLVPFNNDIKQLLNDKLDIKITSSKHFNSACEHFLNLLYEALDIHPPKIKLVVKSTKHLVKNNEIKEARRKK